MPELVTIGEITKNQGNRGEVRVYPLTDFPDRFAVLSRVYLYKNDDLKQMNIESSRRHKGFVILKFTGVDNIAEALNLKNYLVQIPEDELIPLEKDEYYIHNILGFEVRTESGENLGFLDDVLTTGGTDIFMVRSDNGSEEYMIPASREIISSIDQTNKLIVIDPIPGLLDL
ncbi:MAG: ribosome maturation factor RimM [Halanaerobiales bacterium]